MSMFVGEIQFVVSERSKICESKSTINQKIVETAVMAKCRDTLAFKSCFPYVRKHVCSAQLMSHRHDFNIPTNQTKTSELLKGNSTEQYVNKIRWNSTKFISTI